MGGCDVNARFPNIPHPMDRAAVALCRAINGRDRCSCVTQGRDTACDAMRSHVGMIALELGLTPDMVDKIAAGGKVSVRAASGGAK